MNQTNLFGTLLLAGIAQLTSNCVTPAPVGSPEELGMCHGANSCQGKAHCGGAKGSSCRGANACRGKGWVALTRAECTKLGGRFSTDVSEHNDK